MLIAGDGDVKEDRIGEYGSSRGGVFVPVVGSEPAGNPASQFRDFAVVRIGIETGSKGDGFPVEPYRSGAGLHDIQGHARGAGDDRVDQIIPVGAEGDGGIADIGVENPDRGLIFGGEVVKLEVVDIVGNIMIIKAVFIGAESPVAYGTIG